VVQVHDVHVMNVPVTSVVPGKERLGGGGIATCHRRCKSSCRLNVV